jgi:hypothetical protein
LSLTPKSGYSGVYFKVLVADPLVTSEADTASLNSGSASKLVQKTQHNVGASFDYRAAAQPSQASAASADFGPGLVIMGCFALFAILMSRAVWARKNSRPDAR